MSVFYIDASVPKPVSEAIAAVRGDVLFAGGPNAPPVSEEDDVWLQRAGAEHWIIVFRDKRIRKRPRERQALLGSGVRAFCLTGAGNYSKWETLRLLVYQWPGIETRACQQAGPYIYGVTWQAFRPLNIPDPSH